VSPGMPLTGQPVQSGQRPGGRLNGALQAIPLVGTALTLAGANVNAGGVIVDHVQEHGFNPDVGNLFEFSEYDDTLRAIFGGDAAPRGRSSGPPMSLHRVDVSREVPAPVMSLHRAAAGDSSQVRITSGHRTWGVRDSGSGHVRGTAIDVAGPGLPGYLAMARSMGAHAVDEHGHGHVDWGDTAPGGLGSGLGGATGRRHDTRTDRAAIVNFNGPVYGLPDLDRRVVQLVESTHRRLEREDLERHRIPLGTR
jgi:hypothetical protein